MKFNQSAVVSEVLNVLKTAAKEDNFDGFKVDLNSIEQVSPPPTDTSGTKGKKKKHSVFILGQFKIIIFSV